MDANAFPQPANKISIARRFSKRRTLILSFPSPKGVYLGRKHGYAGYMFASGGVYVHKPDQHGQDSESNVAKIHVQERPRKLVGVPMPAMGVELISDSVINVVLDRNTNLLALGNR